MAGLIHLERTTNRWIALLGSVQVGHLEPVAVPETGCTGYVDCNADSALDSRGKRYRDNPRYRGIARLQLGPSRLLAPCRVIRLRLLYKPAWPESFVILFVVIVSRLGGRFRG